MISSDDPVSVRSGVYRVRRGIFGKSILQEYLSFPSHANGQVDAFVRVCEWTDVKFIQAPPVLTTKQKEQP